ncbi:hypothetical protein Nepgr_033848 [Nepenthes gracilis]|uniref:Uncharacterized protein n=1 Tax=Nepenthes gracilis TaxID=150966 RepID=A0AAD3TMI7_NEPGR|nr:hypothetical protein Nepgr_033848 [Nepenthes gracilis]
MAGAFVLPKEWWHSSIGYLGESSADADSGVLLRDDDAAAILVLDAAYAVGSAPVLLSGYAAAILCICSLIVLRYPVPNDAPGPVLNVESGDQLAMLPTGAVGISGPLPCLVVEDALPLPHPIAGDSCSGCCVSNSPNGIVPTEPGPSGGQLTVAPISTEGIFPCSVDGDALPTHHHSSDDAGGGDCISPNGADLDSQSTLWSESGLFLRLLCGLFHLSGVLSLFLLGHAAGLFLMSCLMASMCLTNMAGAFVLLKEWWQSSICYLGDSSADADSG